MIYPLATPNPATVLTAAYSFLDARIVPVPIVAHILGDIFVSETLIWRSSGGYFSILWLHFGGLGLFRGPQGTPAVNSGFGIDLARFCPSCWGRIFIATFCEILKKWKFRSIVL